ncbi:MAG: hypothetical protein Q9184_004483 [Pyrenodesmia sp. 2 TL-2023]
MSLISGEQLPLPVEPKSIADNPGLHSAWTTLVLLSKEVQGGKVNFQRNVGPIMLAFKYLRAALPKARIVAVGATKEELADAGSAVIAAAKWIGPQAKPLIAQGHTSLSMTVIVARSELDDLRSNIALMKGIQEQEQRHVLHCQRLWKLIDLYRKEVEPQDTTIKTNDVNRALQQLGKMIVPKPLPPVEQSPSAWQPHRTHGRAGSRPASSRAQIAAILKVTDEDRKLISRYEDGPAPKHGLLQSPVAIKPSSIQTLTGSQWLDDNVIDAYLALVCHAGNGHFDAVERGDASTLLKSPKYQPWPSQIFTGVDIDSRWPPFGYPSPALEDVQHHFFPFLASLQKNAPANHWVLFHVHKQGTAWRADFLSSAPGYGRRVRKEWQKVANDLWNLSNGSLDLIGLELREPARQVRQTNSDDCGILMLYTIRWMMEGWSFGTLNPNDCRRYRHRTIVDLERWHLD